MKPGIVITAHNHWKDLGLPCLRSVLRYTPEPFHIYLFDNESHPLIDPISDPHVTWIRVPDQTAGGGLTGTWNRGIWLAQLDGCDRVVLLNHDTLVDRTWAGYLELLGMLDGPVGPGTDHTRTPYQVIPPVQAAIKEVPFLTGLKTFPEINGFCFGASMRVFEENQWGEIHFFDPFLPFAGNENEWCDRWRAKGKSCYVHYDTFVHHENRGEWRPEAERGRA